VVGERLVQPHPLDVEDLAADRQDRLRLGVAALDGGAAGRVALDDEDLADRGVAARAVAELAGHAAALEDALAAGRLAGLARRGPGGRRLHRLADDVARLRRVGLQPGAELVVDDLLREGPGLGVAELGLGLALELRLAELDRDDGGETLADVVAREVVVLL